MMLDQPAVKVFRAVAGGARTHAEVRLATGLSPSVVVTRLEKLRAEGLVRSEPRKRSTLVPGVVEIPLV